MKAFFQALGYPEALLNCDLSTVSRNEALRPPAERDSAESRVPLVLKYNQFNTGTKRILLDNFETLLSDPATRTIYPGLPLVTATYGIILYTLPKGPSQLLERSPAIILAA